MIFTKIEISFTDQTLGEVSIVNSQGQLPSNRKFGLFFSLIFFFLAFYLTQISSELLGFISLIISIFFLISALFFDSVLLPLNKLWMKLGLLLGMIVSPLVMGIIFFTLFVPIGLIMRLFDRDELRLKMRPRDSHWKPREHDESCSDSFNHQF